ncbi:TonB family protein [Bordetella genomosp. 9]|uniref:TonB family protein n=1 Tax=Bordetella genomosp. 9 TaxID=1416803 RepID=UPI000A322D8B|nr:TonB family protein [Bordetella genomosp. 9]
MHAYPYSPLTRTARWLGAPAQHRLWLGLAISLIFHALVLAVRFAPPRTPRPPAQSLEVILVNARTETAPAQADVRAQASVEGGGDAEKGMAQSPLPQSGDAPSAVVLEAMRKRQASLEEAQQRLLSQLQASTQVSPPRLSGEPVPDATTPGRDEQDQDSVLQNAQVAALAARVQAYNKRPRREFVAPSAEASRYAQYLDAWRSRIEAVGTQHYPDEARGRVYGSLRMTVYVRADGSVADVEIDQPSPHAVLNQAARRIVQLAAPFAPFPPDIARDTDVLAITRTWNFVNDKLETQAP